MEAVPMESWRLVLRKGFLPQFSDEGLEALRSALESDAKTLLQGATTSPPPLQCVQDWPCEGACPVSTAAAALQFDSKGFSETTVGETESAFAKACFACDQALGEPAGCRFALNWIDDTPRDEMRRELLGEVRWEQAVRKFERDVELCPQL